MREASWRPENDPSASTAEDRQKEPGRIQKEGMQVAIRQPEVFNSIQVARSHSSRSDPQSAFFVRHISSPRQNISLIRSWIDRCLREHKGDCQLSSGGVDISSLSLRVIDVEARCVIKAPPLCRYVAISYVWGNAKQVLLMTTNEEAFCRPGGLPKGIPATIEDAMAFCQMLGEGYLWVDALCIYQDPPEDPNINIELRATVAEQIRNMDAIYSSAVFTIANAAASSADDSIPGVRFDAPSRVRLPSFQIGENLHVAATIANAWEYVSLHSKWDTRGWTFQEKILSKRLLVVTEHFSFFRCPSMLWREDRFEADLFAGAAGGKAQIWEWEDGRGLHRATPRNKDQEAVKKALDEYQRLVKIYIYRKFTHDKDVLMAFQGIEQTMKSSVGAFFCGLPTRAFNTALTWTCGGQPRRRENFPSWSWAGWEWPEDLEFRFTYDLSKQANQLEGRIPFYQLIMRRPVRRAGGDPLLSLTDEDVDICIVNKSGLGDEEDHKAGAFSTTASTWHPAQPGHLTWQEVAEQLRGYSPLVIDRLDQLLIFYAIAITPNLSGTGYHDFGYWAQDEIPTEDPAAELRKRNWIVVQHWGYKHVLENGADISTS